MPDLRALLSGRIGYALRLAHEAAQQSFAAALAGTGLAPVHADLLMLIGFNPGIKPSELADALARDRSSITGALHVLQERGLIRREATTRDRRASLLYLTEAGEEARRFVAAVADAHERLLDRIAGPDEKPRMMALLDRIGAALAEGGAGR